MIYMYITLIEIYIYHISIKYMIYVSIKLGKMLLRNALRQEDISWMNFYKLK